MQQSRTTQFFKSPFRPDKEVRKGTGPCAFPCVVFLMSLEVLMELENHWWTIRNLEEKPSILRNCLHTHMQTHVDLREDSASGNITARLGELALLHVQDTCLGKVSALWFQNCRTRGCPPGYHGEGWEWDAGWERPPSRRPPGWPRQQGLHHSHFGVGHQLKSGHYS